MTSKPFCVLSTPETELPNSYGSMDHRKGVSYFAHQPSWCRDRRLDLYFPNEFSGILKVSVCFFCWGVVNTWQDGAVFSVHFLSSPTLQLLLQLLSFRDHSPAPLINDSETSHPKIKQPIFVAFHLPAFLEPFYLTDTNIKQVIWVDPMEVL